jgi:hypothetical protein
VATATSRRVALHRNRRTATDRVPAAYSSNVFRILIAARPSHTMRGTLPAPLHQPRKVCSFTPRMRAASRSLNSSSRRSVRSRVPAAGCVFEGCNGNASHRRMQLRTFVFRHARDKRASVGNDNRQRYLPYCQRYISASILCFGAQRQSPYVARWRLDHRPGCSSYRSLFGMGYSMLSPMIFAGE